MKGTLKSTIAICIAIVMVISIMPFTAYTADWIPSGYKDFVFDAEYYAYKYPSVAAEYGSTDAELYAHFQEYGVDEGKSGSPTFSVVHYLGYNEDLKTQFGTDYRAALLHYCSTRYPGTIYQSSYGKFFAGSFDAVISRAEDSANGAFNVGVSETATSESTGKYNVQAVVPDITDTKQIWTFKYSTSGYYTITNKYTGTVLDVNGGLKGDSINVSTYNSNDSDAQKWRLLPRCNGEYVIAPVHASHFTVLDIGGSTADGTNVTTYKYNHTDAQVFNIQILIPDSVKGVVFDYKYYASKYPDVAKQYGSTEAELYEHFGKFGLMEGKQGSPVFDAQTYLKNGSYSTSIGNHYTAAVIHFSNNYGKTGIKTAPSEYIADEFYTQIFHSKAHTAVGIANTSGANGTNVQAVANNPSNSSQIWKFTYNSDDGTYTITNKNTGLALDVANAASANGTNIQTYTSNLSSAQRWYVYKKSTTSFVLSPKNASGAVMDFAGGATSAATNLQIYKYNGSDAQAHHLCIELPSNIKAAVFDVDYYADKHPDIAASSYGTSDAGLLMHFCRFGIHEGRQGSPVFSIKHYISYNSDVSSECGNRYVDALMHYSTTGVTAKKYKTAPSLYLGDKFDANIAISKQDVNIGVSDTLSGTSVNSVIVRDENDGAPAQIWTFTLNSNGSYTITNKLTGDSLNVNEGDIDNGTIVNTYTANTSLAQQWYIYEISSGMAVLAPAHGGGLRVLDVKGGMFIDGRAVDIYTYNRTNAQLMDINIIDTDSLSSTDPNGDGIFNAKDILHITKFINDPITYAYKPESDPNRDGVIDADDLAFIEENMGKKYSIWYQTLKADDSLVSSVEHASVSKHTLLAYDNVLFEKYMAIRAGFVAKGCEIYSNTVKGSLYSTTFIDGEDFYHIYWSEHTRKLRIVEAFGDADSLPSKNMYFGNERVAESTITQLGSTYLNGMGYVVQLYDGSFIIVDGGYGDEDTKLYNKLVEMNGGDKENIVIRAWIITHSHGDHFTCFRSFSSSYGSCVELQHFISCTETAETTGAGWDSYMSSGKVYDDVAKFGGAKKILTAHTGMDFKFGDVNLEILFATDDILIDYTPDDKNDMSLIMRFYTDKKSALILGDAGQEQYEMFEPIYGTYLKSDMCQASHHGVEDFPLEGYELIRAPIMFYPCDQALYDADERFNDVRDAVASSDYIEEILIHEHGDFTRSLNTFDPEITQVIPNMSTSYADYINYRDYLVNTDEKINEDKELTVLFYGGSLTNGYGASNESQTSWRALTCSWFTNTFPDTDFTFINRAIGESGTFLGTYRLKKDVIDANPDLIFLEYAINDKYFGSDYTTTKMRVETIVREIKKALPETEIIMLITTDVYCLATNQSGALHTQGQAHEDIAAAYGIPSLHVGRLLAKTCNYSSTEFYKYAVDIVHLNDAGYKIYYNCVEEFLTNSLVKADLSTVNQWNRYVSMQSDFLFDGNRTHYQPTAELLSQSTSLGGTGVTHTNAAYTGNTTSMGYFTIDSASDVFVFKFTGTEVAMWCNLKNADYLVSIDGGAYTQKTASQHTPAVIAEGLTSGEHTIKIKMVSGGNTFKIGSFFTRDASLATSK